MVLPSLNLLAASFLLFALIHTFSSSFFKRFQNPILHLLSEVEFIFVLWGALYWSARCILTGPEEGVHWVSSLSFAEPVFVFFIMTLASTRPVLDTASRIIGASARILPRVGPFRSRKGALLFALFTLGPLLGSFITEPAAMTVTALLLRDRIWGRSPSLRLRNSTIAFLFVNISIGGLLTSFAAPPVLMVAHPWNWDTSLIFKTFGWKAILAVVVNSLVLLRWNREELASGSFGADPEAPGTGSLPVAMAGIQLLLVAGTVALSHHPLLLLASAPFLWIHFRLNRKTLGTMSAGPGLLVGGFLAGLTILTADQGFWVSPLLTRLGDFKLYLGATLLTAITDNAALTSLAARAEGFPEASRYAVLAGAVVGGGLTLIANAPNPAGYSLLKDRFGKSGLPVGTLFRNALLPTLIAGGIFWIRF